MWNDLDGDGVQDPGEPGIEGVGLELVDSTGQVVGTTTTDVNGVYTFTNLPALDWTVRVDPSTLPSGFTQSGDPDGALDGQSTVPLAAGQTITTVDFGYEPLPASVSGTVYADLNDDGLFDPAAGETGIGGVSVRLQGGAVDQTVVTNPDGTYSFPTVPPGTYTLTETQPTEFDDGQDTAGTGAIGLGNDQLEVTVGPGGASTGNNFGELPTSSLAGTVYVDLDASGLLNPDEPGIQNVTVTLTGTDDAGNPVERTAVTDAGGAYLFDVLRAGTYTVTETQPTDYIDGAENAGTAGGAVINDQVSDIPLGDREDATGYDFGELVPPSLSGRVVDDAGTGIPNVTIDLTGTDDQGNLVQRSMTTGPDGSFLFDGIPPGTYTVTETQPLGYGDGPETVGTGGGDASVDDVISGIVLVAGQAATDYVFAEQRSSLAGTVFEDPDNDGVQDAGELGIAGVSVTLTGTDGLGNPVELSTVTDADGNYVFAGLLSGTYTVSEAQPVGYFDGIDAPGSAGGDASVNDTISAISLAPGTDAVDYDFGELPPSSLAGTVFEDPDNDGVQDAGELGIAGVSVTLTGTDDLGNPVELSTVTDADGNYVFSGLRPGTYTVTETQPAGYFDGIDTPGSEGGDASVNDTISTISLAPGTDAVDYDFGELPPSSISGTVFQDLDNDGVQDAGEPGIPDVPVTLTGTDDLGNLVELSTVTDADGNYGFSGLRPGIYAVTEAQPAGYFDGIDTPGSEGGDVSVNDTISAVPLAPGTDAVDYDFGELLPSSLAGTVFQDPDNDGVQDGGEPGIAGVSVTLTGVEDLDNPVELSTVTDADGNYVFTGLRPGTYAVTEAQPDGYLDGIDTPGTAGGTSGPPQADTISAISLASGTDAVGYDFGELLPSSIAGTVFEDLDNDGVVDSGEPGIPNVTISLTGTDDLGNLIAVPAVTDADGNYVFSGLRPGTYAVTETQPDGYIDGIDTPGSQGGDASVNDTISAIPLPSGTDAVDYDFGELVPPGISGTVYEDLDNDGVQDPDESGIPDVPVTLTGTDDRGDPVELSTVTGADGKYSFGGLRPGTYTVTETQPAGYFDGIDTPGTEGGDASVNDTISAVPLASGTDAVGYDFGELLPSSLAGTVFEDPDNDGAQDAGELGIAGVSMTLTGTDDLGNPVELSTVTDADGNYVFTGLRPGIYAVTEAQPAGYFDGIDTPGSEGGDVSVNDTISAVPLASGTDAVDYDFGELMPSSLAGTVFQDLDNDGVQDAGELGIPDVPVTLTGTDDLGNPVELSTVTDADGNYVFTGLRPGTYAVTESQPDGYLDGIDTPGSAGGDASVDDAISAVPLASGTDAVGYDFGELLPSSISGTVFQDPDNDGVQGAGEPGIPDVPITLTGTDDLGNPVELSTTADADGNYVFAGLRPGTYAVTEAQPDAYLDGIDTPGSEGGDPSVNDTISAVPLASGTDAVGYDFGELVPSSIAGSVFEDPSNDGVRDAGEPGIPDVPVTLTGTDDLGNPVEVSGTTDADGNYVFAGLRPGTYAVTEAQPDGYLDGVDTAGSVGGDVSVNDTASAIPLASGTDAVGYDFGELLPSSIAGSVFEDPSNDGVRDAGEPGIPDVPVTLTGTDDLGNPVELSTTTDADGNYVFQGLRPGTYAVTEAQPDGYLDGIDTPGSAGGDGSVNDTISTIPLAPGTNAVDYDFGELVSPSIAGTVFEDLSNDGVRDAGEPGIADVPVTLTGTDDLGNPVELSGTTDPDGNYVFQGLRPGTYTVTESQPDGYLDGVDTPGSAGGTAEPPPGDTISAIPLASGTDAVEYDFGELLPSSISGTVFQDLDNDGVQGAGEPGIPDVPVTLTGTDDLGNPVELSTTTDPDGNYVFAGLRPGTYTVTESQPAGYLDGIDKAGSVGGDASVNDTISTIPLAPGTNAVGYDFGELVPSSIAGTVFEDPSNDGVQDAGEPGIPDVPITLTGTDDLGNPVELSTTTDPDGNYVFQGLRPGTYTVTEGQPAGYLDGIDTPGSAGGDGSVNDTISTIPLAPGTNAVGYDFGELVPSSIAGTVFEDPSNDGVQDAGEPGIPDVPITLTGTDDLGNPVELSTTTDPDGNYVFQGLRPGTYTVTEGQPAGYLDGVDTPGSAGGDGSVNDTISTIPLAPGTKAVGYDFGELVPSSIAGTVFEDPSNDGVQDAGEPGIPDVPITLTGTDDLGNPVELSTTTDADGNYEFTGLRPGSYAVTEVQPDGYLDGIDTPGSAGGDGSVNDTISTIPLAPGTNAVGYDFGELVPSSIAGTVFEDPSNDGVQDAGEPGIPDVPVTLTGTDDLGNPVELSGTTDPDGNYVFQGQRPGTYTVTESQPDGYLDGVDTPGSAGGTAEPPPGDTISVISLASGTDAVDYDFGELVPSSISGTVFEDPSNDGVQDAGEPGIPDVPVTLTGTDDLGNPVELSTTTEPDGNYVFQGLRPGSYAVTESQPAGFLDGIDTPGSAGGTAEPPPGDTISVISLASGTDAVDYDFGELRPSSIAGSVFVDFTDDGVRADDEPGIEGVTLTLSGTDDLGNPVELQAVSGADGTYRFGDLRPGTYTVTETQPETFSDGRDTPGSEGGDPSVNDTIASIALPPATDANGYDFGELGTVIAGTIWLDTDGDQVIDLEEEGRLGDIELVLLNDAGQEVARTTTNPEDGMYLFSNLEAGRYSVTEAQPDGYGSTTPNQLALSLPLEGLIGVDFGEQLGSIGDQVWHDDDGDGIQDEGEPGVADVALSLIDDTGGVVASTNTDGEGLYRFTDIPVGTYTVAVEPPPGMALTTPDAGTDDALDSDIDWISLTSAPVAVAIFACDEPAGVTECATRIVDLDAGIMTSEPDLAIVMSADAATVVSGGEVTYSVMVANTGNVPIIGGVSVTDELPEGLTINSSSGTGWEPRTDPTAVVYDHPDTILPGESYETLAITTLVTAPSGALVNRVRLAPLDPTITETITLNNEAEVPIEVQALHAGPPRAAAPSLGARGNQPLAKTGEEHRQLALAAAQLLVLGLGLVLVARRLRIRLDARSRTVRDASQRR